MHQLTFDRSELSGTMIPGGVLCGVWLVGSSLGLWAARLYGDAPEELIFRAGAMDLRFRDACVAAMWPLLLSAFAVFFFHRFGVYLSGLVRGSSLGFSLGVLAELGGMWLAVLLRFSGLMLSPVLLWYLWRRLDIGLRDAPGDAVWCVLAGAVVAAMDTWVVAPFLAAALSI